MNTEQDRPATPDANDARASRAASQRRPRTLAVVTTAIMATLGLYYLANMVRDNSVSTASNPVDARLVALVGIVLPLAVGLMRSFHYSREPAVHHHELIHRRDRVARRHAKSAPRATADRAAFVANVGSAKAAAYYIGANQHDRPDDTNAANAVTTAIELLDALALPELKVPRTDRRTARRHRENVPAENPGSPAPTTPRTSTNGSAPSEPAKDRV